METDVKHGVLMVTYNHERYIGDALASIFLNDVLPYKVIIHDDCSTDRTWQIINDYQKKFPNIIYAKQNKANIGLYANINAVWLAGIQSDCDMLTWCCGDDLLEKNLIENLNNEIVKQKIDVKNEKCIIVTNSALLYPNGKVALWNNYILRNGNMRMERIGKRLSYREVGMSKKLFEDFEPLRSDIGLASDTIFTFHNDFCCEHWYFANFIGAYYRVNVGAVVRSEITGLLESESKAYRILLESEKYHFTDNEKKTYYALDNI